MACEMEEDQEYHADSAGNHRNFDPSDSAIRDTEPLKEIGLPKDQM